MMTGALILNYSCHFVASNDVFELERDHAEHSRYRDIIWWWVPLGFGLQPTTHRRDNLYFLE